ncbi:MAG: hypothetical protein HYV26_20495 [Candidatus Hydrogenedentes bacterium]|nr:hypothetical protein [Candidatus Hydrogenedentota bacterium]
MAVTSDELQRQLRLVLSWREKARRMEGIVTAAAAQGRLDAEQRQFKETTYDAHIYAAETHLKQLRQQSQTLLTRWAAELRQALQKQERLLDLAGSGRWSPQKVNDRNRALLEQIEGLRMEIDHLNHLLQAEKAETLGGFVDLPVEQYATEVDVPEKSPTRRFWEENRLTLFVAGVTLVIGVCGAFYYKTWGSVVTFTSQPPARPGEPISLECHNKTLTTITWYVPWVTADAKARNRDAYGVDLYLRETGSTGFHLYSTATSFWKRKGMAANFQEPIRVQSGMSARASLDLQALRELAPGITALRIVCSRGAGEKLHEFTLDPLP